jgi:putative membrane protein
MQSKNKSFYLVLFFKSILMGTVNKLPGISGGLVALLMGFYIEMINSLKKLNLKFLKLLVQLKFKELDKGFNIYFLIVIFFGILVSYFTTSQLLDFLFVKYELQVWSTFFGMILASNIILIAGNSKWNLNSFLSIFLGLIIGIIISISEPTTENKNLLYVFFCGFVSICGMIIPGLSGSYLLIILGNFKLLLVDSVNAVYNSFLILLGIGSNLKHDIELLNIAIMFALGSITGLLILSKILSYLILNFNKTINQIIIGFVTGSLFIVWPWNYSNQNFEFNVQNLDNFLWMFFGLFIVLFFERYATKK